MNYNAINKINGIFLSIFLVLASNILSAKDIENSTTNTLMQRIETAKVSVSLKNKSIDEILVAICDQAKINYAFDNGVEVDTKNKYSLNGNDITVATALDKLFASTNYTYTIEDERLIITKKMAPKVAKQESKEVVISGKVVDEDGKPLVGATVVALDDSGKGAITDDNGSFTLKVKAGTKVEITFVGMITVERVINEDEKDIVIKMENDDMAVEDIVVNGIFERKANTFTGSVTTISSEELKRTSNSNVLQALKNIDPSILYIDNLALGSDPNATPELVMRGKTSIDVDDTELRSAYQNDPNAPLFILDGFEVSLQKVLDLDMNRVESMTILKDASAKAIYGSKAANGVIVIELKKNVDKDIRVTYNGSIEVQAPDLSSYNLTNAAEKLDVELAYGLFDAGNGSYSADQLALNKLYNQKLALVSSGIDTDWLSKPLQLGVGTKHGISVELGEAALKTVIDLSYNNVVGVMKGSDRTNISGGLTLSYRHDKFLFRNQLTVTQNTANSSPYGSFSEYAEINPYYTPYDQYGNLLQNIAPSTEDLSNSAIVDQWASQLSFVPNPLYNASLNTLLQNKYLDVTNNFDIQYYYSSSLKFTLRYGLTENRSEGDEFYPANHLKFVSYSDSDFLRRGSYSLLKGSLSSSSGRFDVQYNKEIAPKHNLFSNVGFDISQSTYTTNQFSAEGFPNDYMTDIAFARQYTENTTPFGIEETVRDVGYYASVNYSYDDRFNVDGTLRQSASSLYGADNRWGIFWSVGAAWNVHNEKWINKDLFSRFRLRASYGSTGSQSSSAYDAIAAYQYITNKTYEGMIGAYLSSMENPELTWQQRNDLNLGLELNIKNNISVRFDWYRSITDNMVSSLSLAPSVGFPTVQENIGKVENKGFDARVSYTVFNRPSSRTFLTLFAAVSSNTNTLLELSDAMRAYNDRQDELQNSGVDENGNVSIEPPLKYYDGMSMDAIWAMPSLGIDPATGQEMFLRQDANGNYFRSFEYDAASQIVAGNLLPKLQGNFGFTFEHKGFSVNTTFTFKYGGQLYNSTLVNKVENADLTNNVDSRIYTDRWREPGQNTQFKAIQKVSYTDPTNLTASSQTRATTRFVQDRNELVLSSLQLGYDFYRFNFVKKLGFERLRVALNMNEVATFSSIDIERGTQYPFARVFNGSVTLTF